MNDAPESRVRVPTKIGRLAQALALIYLPQLAALVIGPLTECSHCVARFWQLFGVIPGMLLGATWSPDLSSGWVAALAVTLLVWALAFVLVRRPWTRARAIAAVVLGLASAVNAIMLSLLLRM